MSKKSESFILGRLVVDDNIKKQRILESVHNASHPGINRTVDMVSLQYYWPGLTNDVKLYVSKAVPTIVDVLWPSFIHFTSTGCIL